MQAFLQNMFVRTVIGKYEISPLFSVLIVVINFRGERMKPSWFATGNFFLAFLVFLLFGVPFYLMGITVFSAYLSGPIIFYGVVRLHRSRVKQHKILHPPSYAQFTYDIQTGLDKLQSEFENFTLQVTVSNLTAGGE